MRCYLGLYVSRFLSFGWYFYLSSPAGVWGLTECGLTFVNLYLAKMRFEKVDRACCILLIVGFWPASYLASKFASD